VIFKLGVRNIPRRKAQTILIVVGLMLSTLIIAAAFGTGDTLNHSVSATVYRQLGPVDEIVVASSGGDGEGEVNSIITQTIPDSALTLVQDLTKGRDDVDAIGVILVAPAPPVNIASTRPGRSPRSSRSLHACVGTGRDGGGLDTVIRIACVVTDLSGNKVISQLHRLRRAADRDRR